MSEEAKDRLLQEAVAGEALAGLKTHHGYNALIDIFKKLYNEAWEELKEKESEVARSKLRALEDIMSQIDNTVKLGKEARGYYNRLAFPNKKENW